MNRTENILVIIISILLSITLILMAINVTTVSPQISPIKISSIQSDTANVTSHVNLYEQPIYNYTNDLITINFTVPTPIMMFNEISHNTSFLSYRFEGMSPLWRDINGSGWNQSYIDNYTITMLLAFTAIDMTSISHYQGEINIIMDLSLNSTESNIVSNIQNNLTYDQNILQNEYALIASLQLTWEGQYGK